MSPPPDQPIELRRISRVVPSRVADNTFWLGRYVERAENIARILRAAVPRVHHAEDADLGSLLRLHATLGSRNSKLPKRKPATFPLLQKELLSLLTDTTRYDSLPCILAEVARTGGKRPRAPFRRHDAAHQPPPRVHSAPTPKPPSPSSPHNSQTASPSSPPSPASNAKTSIAAPAGSS